MTLLFLTGDGMRGGRLHDRIAGASLVAITSTAPAYRMYAVDDRFPALERVESGGVAVHGELYDVPLATVGGALLPAEPDELELGVVELADGAWALATVLRREYRGTAPLLDIDRFADWREYRKRNPRR
ncbi:gamma-glutamylcyclotransferase [Actinocatenispora sera]|uniref:allophanate hydrolase-related protein n=1 Tax=Actinocatenispora sera TaxID=390989 RepID=UPI0033D1D32E